MKLSEEDRELLRELCNQYKVNYEKVLKLIDTVKEFELKERRTGIYDALKDVLSNNLI